MSDRTADLYRDHIETVRSRHDAALEAEGFEHVAIFGGSSHGVFLDDMEYPFKANFHLEYWVPVQDNPNCFLIYTPGSKPILVFNKPIDFWYIVSDLPTEYWTEHVDLRPVKSLDEAKAMIPSGKVAFVGEWEGEFDSWSFAEANPQGLMDRLHFDRTKKTEYELDCLRKATTLGVKGHLAARDAFREGGSEFEIHLAYLRATQHMEHELPYSNIIAINEHGSTLHYHGLNRTRLPDNERHSFLIDAGAQHNGYASDITRTYPARDGEFTALVDAMESMEKEICAEVRPGVDYKDLHVGAHRKIAKILADQGFINCSPDEAVDKKITNAFFPHGLGHLIGLQVHDVAGFMSTRSGETIPKPEGHPFLRLTRTVEEGMVFTIEPGLYFIDSLLSELNGNGAREAVNWDKVDAFRKYGGVRIEDDVHVTSDGIENLTRDAWSKME